MAQMTGSISKGKPAPKHNLRDYVTSPENCPEHIDFDRIAENVVLVDRSLEDVYESSFGAALKTYNDLQRKKGHPERCIENYLEKVKGDKKLNPVYEFVVQIGNRDNNAGTDVSRLVYEDWLFGFKERYGNQFAVAQAVIHNDEQVPHMHLEVVPTAKSRRGLPVQNSLNKAIEQAGFSDYKDMLRGWDGLLTSTMAYYGISRVAGDKETQMGGVDINTFKRTKAWERDQEKQLAERLKAMEKGREERINTLDAAIDAKEEQLKGIERSLASSRHAADKAEKRLEEARGNLDTVELDIEDANGRLEWLRLDLENAEIDNRGFEEDAELELNRVQGGGLFRTAEDPRYLFDSLRGDRERCEKAVEELGRKRRDLEEEGERAAKAVGQLEKRVADALVAKLDADEIKPVHVGTIITSKQLESFEDRQQSDRITAAIDRAAGRWGEAKRRLAPKVEEYRIAVQKHLDSFVAAAKAWFDGGKADEKPVFKVPRAADELKKYCNVEVVEIKVNAKKRAESAAVKYGLQPKKKPSGSHTLAGRSGKKPASNYRTRSVPSQSITRTQTRATGRNGHSGR